jgi:hypothetical protein
VRAIRDSLREARAFLPGNRERHHAFCSEPAARRRLHRVIFHSRFRGREGGAGRWTLLRLGIESLNNGSIA